MNRVAYTITFGQKGLERLRDNPEAVATLAYLKARGEVTPDGYVQLHLPGCPRQRVWETAKALDAFILEVEVGPGSGGLGGGGAFLEGPEVYARWKAQHPPFRNPEEGLEAVEAILKIGSDGQA